MHKMLSILLLWISVSVGQSIVTDRPDFTESALVVPTKVLQLEMGFQRDDVANSSSTTLFTHLWQYGIREGYELRLGFTGLGLVDKDAYAGDVLVEGKFQMLDKSSGTPVALIAGIQIPSNSIISQNGYGTVVKIALAKDITERFSLGINAGVGYLESGSDWEKETSASLALGYGLTEALGMYLEGYAIAPESAPWKPVFNGGFTYLLKKNLQLDIYTGTNLREKLDATFIGVGVSVNTASYK